MKDLSIQIPKGKIFGFLGPNGAGKTTSLNILTGLLQPTGGSISVEGRDPHSDKSVISDKFGLIPQELVIWETLTVRENMEFVASLYKMDKETKAQRIDRLIQQINLEDKANVLAKNLSGGLKRRLNIILGLVHDPEVVVCDEPTPGLDPQSRTLVWQFIQDLSKKQGKTVILTTHFMEEADRLSDTVAIVDHGSLLVMDKPENLKNSIGEGDLVEIHLNDENYLEPANEAVKTLDFIDQSELIFGTLQIRCLNAASKMAKIFTALEPIEGLEVVDMKIRKSTLEDVFIHLTGRELRD